MDIYLQSRVGIDGIALLERWIEPTLDLLLRLQRNPHLLDYKFRQQVMFIMEMKCAMAKTSKNSDNAKTSGFIQVRWCNVSLTAEDAQKITDTPNDDETVLMAIGSLILEGYSFSAKPTSEGASIQVTLICQNTESVNYAVGLSAYARDLRTALLVLVYKHFEILDGVYSAADSPTGPLFG
jgi:hypothetical protein